MRTALLRLTILGLILSAAVTDARKSESESQVVTLGHNMDFEVGEFVDRWAKQVPARDLVGSHLAEEASWWGDSSAFCGAEKGIEPLSGLRMLRFTDTGGGCGGDVFQDFDLSANAQHIDSNEATFEVSAWFCRAQGRDSEASYHMAVYFHADGENRLGTWNSRSLDFIQPGVWVKASSGALPIPSHTRTIRLRLFSWGECGTGAYDGSYLDLVDATLDLHGQRE